MRGLNLGVRCFYMNKSPVYGLGLWYRGVAYRDRVLYEEHQAFSVAVEAVLHFRPW